MTGLLLFGKARSVLLGFAALGLVALVTRLAGNRVFQLRADESSQVVPWAVLTPLLSACACGLLARSKFAWLERTAARSVVALRTSYSAVLLLAAAVVTYLVTTAQTTASAPQGWASAERNLLGLTGFALLGAALIGSAASWVLPFALAAAALTVGGARLLPWGWLIRRDGDAPALGTAAVLVAVGLLAVAFRGTREPRGDVT